MKTKAAADALTEKYHKPCPELDYFTRTVDLRIDIAHVPMRVALAMCARIVVDMAAIQRRPVSDVIVDLQRFINPAEKLEEERK